MKKIVVIFAAMAAVLSSCQKSELESVSANEIKDIVLNISVSNPGADDTKALVKTGWAKGDQIKIWYDSNTGETPDLVIKYDGDNWNKDELATVSGKQPLSGENKYIKAVYNNFVIVASTDKYTYTDNTLSFHIDNWKFLTEIQVVVKGLDYDVNEPYTLSCDKFTPLDKTGFKVTEAGIESVVKTEGNPAVGQANADGVAFVFATAEYSSSDAEFKFTLKNLINEDFGTREYTATTNKISEVQDHKSIKALTIESSSFTAPGPEYVVMKMGTGDSAYTLKWATMNLGAEKETDYGYYFAWGAAELAYSSLSSDKFTFVASRPASYGGSGWTQSYGFAQVNTPYYDGSAYTKYTSTDSKTVLESGDDAATKLWGGNWRMPTSQEFIDLYNACGGTSTPKTGGSTSTTAKGVYWCTDYDGVKGLLFIAEAGGPHLFFPAAGFGDGKSLSLAGNYGFYWSSSRVPGAEDINRAYYLTVRESDVTPQDTNYRYLGFSVRPVSD